MSRTTQQPTILDLTLGTMSRFGSVESWHDEEKVLVFGGIVGEEVQAQVVRCYRSHTAAKTISVKTPSPYRIEPSCPYFGECSGCQWQHISYDHQLQLKVTLVMDTLRDVGGIPDAPIAPVIPASDLFGYRNHARFTVGPGGTLGFVNRDTHRFVRIDQCLLMHPWINNALSALQGKCGETTQLQIRYGVNTGDCLIQPSLHDPRVPLSSGQKYYEEALFGRRFRISAASFFQVNIPQTERMVDMICQRLGLTDIELVIDAYAGVGTFAALIATRARRVIAIEDSASAIADARFNIREIPNVELMQARTEKALYSMPQAPDILLLDPPRTGCHSTTLQAILKQPPKRIVYISCDPQALARDLRILCHGPYKLDELVPVDLFPQTYHIECIATLNYTEAKYRAYNLRQELVLASASPRRQEILSAMGIKFKTIPPSVKEILPISGGAVSVARQRALDKTLSVASNMEHGIVIGADTIVADGECLLGKPGSAEEARSMLHRLRGQEHRVITGLAVVDVSTGEHLIAHRTSLVTMREYSDDEIMDYIATGDPFDKAGAYAIQHPGFHPTAKVTGCYLNVVGLPPCTLLQLLNRMAIFPVINPQWNPPGKCRDCRQLALNAAHR